MLEKPRRLLATILIGNTFANVISSVAAAVLTANFAASFDIPSYMVLIFEVLAVTFVILILSEITPKTMAIKSPLGVSRFISRPIYFFFIVLRPIAAIMAKSAFLLERTLPRPANRLKSTDIRTMAQVGSEQGTINNDEQELIENVIEFGNTTVKEIMTSRMNIKAVDSTDSLSEVISMIQDAGFSRMPLYQDDIDHIIGIVFAKDILPHLFTDTNNTILNWKTLAKPVHFIPPTKKLDDLLRDFQQKKTHMAVVVDEYGGTEGIITLDDLLEEIIGNFEDEHSDEDDKLYVLQKNGTYLFDPAIDLDDMETVLNVDLTTDDDEYETLGGLVYHLMERLPKMGEMIIFNDLELYIHTVEKNRIKKVRVRKLLTKSEG
jgi:CBS domain containing-hemolysin-like protein